MAKSCNQKGKILYLQKMLSETTSQNPVTMQEILAKLEEQGIRAERKSIYDDMETLRDFGMDIHYRRGRGGESVCAGKLYSIIQYQKYSEETGGREIMKITIGHLYPDLLNLYGDRGNIQCLMKRCQWRGIEAETIPFELDDKIDFSKLDIVLLGGGSDREQMIVCEKLQKIQPDFKAYVEDNGVVIAICGGYQLLGKYYKTDQGNMKGLDLVDLYTEQGEGRLIQNIVLQSELFDMPIVGFENHGGRTCINNNKPLGKVLYGAGNDGKSGYEGVVYKNVIGTYLHGPLLPKNPQLADWLIQHALERKYGKETELTPLDDSQEKEANDYIYHRFVRG